jgi:hypothetical protein
VEAFLSPTQAGQFLYCQAVFGSITLIVEVVIRMKRYKLPSIAFAHSRPVHAPLLPALDAQNSPVMRIVEPFTEPASLVIRFHMAQFMSQTPSQRILVYSVQIGSIYPSISEPFVKHEPHFGDAIVQIYDRNGESYCAESGE